jgi:nitroimidazol reductase NimA-like FMN-containing flavoprotein (pyridoxamine 5'-phosphate oxidase superfamily)
MRRKDKEITEREIIDAIINRALICHLACTMNEQPYVVPISFGYDGDCIYFHSSPSGKKISILKDNPRVCLAFETDVEIVKDPNNACDWTVHYKSVIAEGIAEELTQPSEKALALNKIMEHYSGETWSFPENELQKTSIWRIRLESVSAKKSPKDK